jgi:hypothetical protein
MAGDKEKTKDRLKKLQEDALLQDYVKEKEDGRAARVRVAEKDNQIELQDAKSQEMVEDLRNEKQMTLMAKLNMRDRIDLAIKH